MRRTATIATIAFLACSLSGAAAGPSTSRPSSSKEGCSRVFWRQRRRSMGKAGKQRFQRPTRGRSGSMAACFAVGLSALCEGPGAPVENFFCGSEPAGRRERSRVRSDPRE